MLQAIHVDIPFSNAAQFLSLTGVRIEMFNNILPFFELAEKQLAENNYQKRIEKNKVFSRKPSMTRKQGVLLKPEEKLYFILFYYKNYPLQQMMANKFRMSISSANKNIHKYSNVLKTSLSILGVLPKRTITTHEEFKQVFENIDNLLIDVTERPINRPSDYEEQRNNFSGKKCQHTNKNLIIATNKKFVKYLGPTSAGTHNDYRMLKDEFPPEKNFFEGKNMDVDLGFNGIKKEYRAKKINIPHKKPRKSKNNPIPKLTEQQKKENRDLSRLRVVVEHAIGGVKVMHILRIKFRNWVDGFVDEVIEVSTGIWNLKLSY